MLILLDSPLSIDLINLVITCNCLVLVAKEPFKDEEPKHCWGFARHCISTVFIFVDTILKKIKKSSLQKKEWIRVKFNKFFFFCVIIS